LLSIVGKRTYEKCDKNMKETWIEAYKKSLTCMERVGNMIEMQRNIVFETTKISNP
jgi:hypothetical protein